MRDYFDKRGSGILGKMTQMGVANILRQNINYLKRGDLSSALIQETEAIKLYHCVSVREWIEFAIWCQIREGDYGSPSSVSDLRADNIVKGVLEFRDEVYRGVTVW